MPRKLVKTTAKQWNEVELVIGGTFRKKCYVCRDWIELGERCYATGYPMWVYRHCDCARTAKKDGRSEP